MENDKSKIIILIVIINFLIILIVGFIFIAFFDLREDAIQDELNTTTRRTVSTTTKVPITTITTTNVQEETTNTITTTTKVTTVAPKTTKRTTTKVPTTKVPTTTSQVIIESDIIPIPDVRETTTEPTTYPDSVDEWEWAIVNYINEERIRNGLNALGVAKDLRQLAEEGADLWLGYGDAVIKEYLYGNSNYRMYTNLAGETPYSLYQRTVNATKVTTDPNLRYLGVGVLLKRMGANGLPTYYYVIIYE